MNLKGGSASAAVLTPRLVLTPVGLDAVEDLLVLYGDPKVAYWTGPWTREAVEVWAAGMSARWSDDGVGKWMARGRPDGSVVGRGGFTRVDLDGETVLELGWAVRDARTGRGYATELGRAALAWAAEYLPGEPVVAFTEVHNRASRAVMERLGMLPARIIWREGLVEGRTGVQPDAPFTLYRMPSRREPPDVTRPATWRSDPAFPIADRAAGRRRAMGARPSVTPARRAEGPRVRLLTTGDDWAAAQREVAPRPGLTGVSGKVVGGQRCGEFAGPMW